MRLAFVFALSLFPLCAQEYTVAMLSRHLLTNQGVIQLAKAGFDELFIVERIRTSRTRFDTSVEGLIALKQAGVSEDLIRVMAQQERRNYPAPFGGVQTAGAVASTNQEPKVMVEKHWWGFRWTKVPETARER